MPLPLLGLLGSIPTVWKVAAIAAALAGLATFHFIKVSNAYDDGRESVFVELAAAAQKQTARVSKATVHALEKINAEDKRQLKIYSEAVRKLRDSGADCPVPDSVARDIERLREGPARSGEGDNPG